jgi:hypothetical protein
VNASFADELEEVSERILRSAGDDTGEVGRPTSESLSDRQVEGRVGAQANESLETDAARARRVSVSHVDKSSLEERKLTMTSTVS